MGAMISINRSFGILRPLHGAAYSFPWGRSKRSAWQNAFWMSRKQTSNCSLMAIWKKRVIDSQLGMGLKTWNDPDLLSGSWWPWRHHLDLNLKFPTPGTGFFLLFIRLVITRSGELAITLRDSSLDSTLTDPMLKIASHSLRSEASKPLISSGVACFMSNSEFLALVGLARKDGLSASWLIDISQNGKESRMSSLLGQTSKNERRSSSWSSGIGALSSRSIGVVLGPETGCAAEEGKATEEEEAVEPLDCWRSSRSSLLRKRSASLSSLFDSRSATLWRTSTRGFWRTSDGLSPFGGVSAVWGIWWHWLHVGFFLGSLRMLPRKGSCWFSGTWWVSHDWLWQDLSNHAMSDVDRFIFWHGRQAGLLNCWPLLLL